MPYHPCSSILDKSTWRFDAIACSEPNRALALETAGPPKALLKALVSALDQALDLSDVRMGREHAKDQWDDCRAVVQFYVGAQLFDWFFNARSGYRAHFRRHYSCGLAFNSQIIEALRRCLDARLPDAVPGWELNSDFESCGDGEIPKSFLIDSLTPDLSKVWFCTKQIQQGGKIEYLPMGVLGPRILMSRDDSWAAPCRDDHAAWLDVKGAFVGKTGLYQPKDQVVP